MKRARPGLAARKGAIKKPVVMKRARSGQATPGGAHFSRSEAEGWARADSPRSWLQPGKTRREKACGRKEPPPLTQRGGSNPPSSTDSAGPVGGAGEYHDIHSEEENDEQYYGHYQSLEVPPFPFQQTGGEATPNTHYEAEQQARALMAMGVNFSREKLRGSPSLQEAIKAILAMEGQLPHSDIKELIKVTIEGAKPH